MNHIKTYRIVPATAAQKQEVTHFVIPTMTKLYPEGAFNQDPDDLRRFNQVYLEPADACFYIAAEHSM